MQSSARAKLPLQEGWKSSLLPLSEPLHDPEGPAALYPSCPVSPGWMSSLLGWPGAFRTDYPTSLQITAAF